MKEGDPNEVAPELAKAARGVVFRETTPTSAGEAPPRLETLDRPPPNALDQCESLWHYAGIGYPGVVAYPGGA